MHRIFTRIATWLQALAAVPCTDPLAGLSPRQLADLPAIHPAGEPGRC